jgi:type I restriction enzyme S subunit
VSFPRYPAYKDSGVDLLGEVPEHWEIIRLKRTGSIRYGLGEPPAYVEEGVRLIRATNVCSGKLSNDGMAYVNPADIPPKRILWLEEGDIVVVRSGAYTGDSAIIPLGYGPCIAGFDMVLRIHASHPEFVQYALLGAYLKDHQIELKRMRAAQPHLNSEELGECLFLMPPLVEQSEIASFLDHETAKIDALIAEQQRLIELLHEKRQAVISHTVTKGLNPDAPMKDSGVEWLGEVPEHWRVVKLGRLLVESPKNGLSPEITPSGTTPTFSIAAVRGGRVDIEPHLKYCDVSTDKASPYFVFQGDVLVLRGSGSKDLVGTAGIVVDPPPANCIYPDILIRIRPSTLITSWYLVQVLNCTAIRPQVVVAAQTAAGIWKLSGGDLCEIRVPCPPPEELLELEVNAIAAMEAIDDLIVSTESSTQLLQERRSALISAAVTGQIDVRGLVPDAEAA